MKYVFPVCLKSNQSRKIVVTTSGAHKLIGVPPSFLLPCFDEKKKKKKKSAPKLHQTAQHLTKGGLRHRLLIERYLKQLFVLFFSSVKKKKWLLKRVLKEVDCLDNKKCRFYQKKLFGKYHV